MSNKALYDCAITGGGLAGLTLSIRLAKLGHKVILFEKEQYPFHKVCGEYVSLESWNYLDSLGLALSKMQVPLIHKLIVSSPDGNELKHNLPFGGFGISRYKLDNDLKNIAVQQGVSIIENCKVDDIVLKDDIFKTQTAAGVFESHTCCGSFGKRSNLDIKWKRGFIQQAPNKLNNYIAVKYHVNTDFAQDTIALHNFKNGYCGISKIEDDKYCLCYLTNAANLKESGNSIEDMEKNILCRNPHLKKIFDRSIKLYAQPLSISQISFQQKAPVENNILMIGDAAGMITPLCGNGMSMAMHGGKIASMYIDEFLKGKINRRELEDLYVSTWVKTFSKRMKTGRVIQRFFGKSAVTNLFIKTMKAMPGLAHWLIKQTHGKPF